MANKELLEIVRYELACQGSGRAALHALRPQTKLDPALVKHHKRVIENWLNREMSAFAPKVSVSMHKYTVSFNNGMRLQLRFSSHFSRWILLVKRDTYWWPQLPPPGKVCISLPDWLGLMRQVVTGRVSLTEPGPQI